MSGPNLRLDDPAEYAREQRQKARNRVLAAAKNTGTSPTTSHEPDDLLYIFEGDQAAIDAAEAVAAEARKKVADGHVRREFNQALQTRADRIQEDWQRQARAAAIEQARRELAGPTDDVDEDALAERLINR